MRIPNQTAVELAFFCALALFLVIRSTHLFSSLVPSTLPSTCHVKVALRENSHTIQDVNIRLIKAEGEVAKHTALELWRESIRPTETIIHGNALRNRGSFFKDDEPRHIGHTENTPRSNVFVSAGRDYSFGAVEPALENRCLRPGPRRLNKTWAAVAGIMHETTAHLSWTKMLREKNFDVLIYDKIRPGAKHYLPNDTTKEDGPYLAYIINYYDCLPPFTLFLHSSPPSMHTVDSFLPCLREQPLRAASRMWLMLGDCNTCFSDGCPRDQSTTDFQARLWERLSAQGYGNELPAQPRQHTQLHIAKCPQFIASRQSIQQWPREFWVTVLEYVYSVSRTLKIAKVPAPRANIQDDWHTVTPYWTGNGMEQTWSLLFDTAYGRHPASSNDMCQFFRPGCPPCIDERYKQ